MEANLTAWTAHANLLTSLKIVKDEENEKEKIGEL
jgi:hypothetical protein